MNVSVTSRTGTVALLGTVLAHGSWVALGLVVATGVAVSAYCVCAERARRKTLIALLRAAPTGTVVSQKRGPGGPEMRVQVGEVAVEAAGPISRLESQLPGSPGGGG